MIKIGSPTIRVTLEDQTKKQKLHPFAKMPKDKKRIVKTAKAKKIKP